jgi:putative SOS response-associated peptidase YedK
MAVILDPANYARWLGETPATGAELQLLLAPFPTERMQAHEIGPAIGNVRNDDPGLIERVRRL